MPDKWISVKEPTTTQTANISYKVFLHGYLGEYNSRDELSLLRLLLLITTNNDI